MSITNHITPDSFSYALWRVFQQREQLRKHYEYLVAEWIEKSAAWSQEHQEVHLAIMSETAEDALITDAMLAELFQQMSN